VWAVQIPLAWALPKYTSLGVYGVRWAIATGSVLGALAYVIYFKAGRWKLKQV
jgi:Na+-driven multidrug efflux pump